MSRPDSRPDVALVTGAASGIGAALASDLGARGAHVVATDRDGATLDARVAELTAAGSAVTAVEVDVTSSTDIERAVATAAELGTLTTACLNAGVTTAGVSSWELGDDTIDFMIGVNLVGLFRSVRSVVPAMLDHGRPARILITASIAGMLGAPTAAGYAASKAGAIALAKTLRDELAGTAPQITVSVLNPGHVKTNLIHTSAAQQDNPALHGEIADMAHDLLDAEGLAPNEVARLALDALDEGRFWIFTRLDDEFTDRLRSELDDLRTILENRPSTRETR